MDPLAVILALSALGLYALGYLCGYIDRRQKGRDDDEGGGRDDPPRRKPLPPHAGDGCARRGRPYVTVSGKCHDVISKP